MEDQAYCPLVTVADKAWTTNMLRRDTRVGSPFRRSFLRADSMLRVDVELVAGCALRDARRETYVVAYRLVGASDDR
jgi:hypothetical protein